MAPVVIKTRSYDREAVRRSQRCPIIPQHFMDDVEKAYKQMETLGVIEPYPSTDPPPDFMSPVMAIAKPKDEKGRQGGQ